MEEQETITITLPRDDWDRIGIALRHASHEAVESGQTVLAEIYAGVERRLRDGRFPRVTTN